MPKDGAVVLTRAYHLLRAGLSASYRYHNFSVALSQPSKTFPRPFFSGFPRISWSPQNFSVFLKSFLVFPRIFWSSQSIFSLPSIVLVFLLFFLVVPGFLVFRCTGSNRVAHPSTSTLYKQLSYLCKVLLPLVLLVLAARTFVLRAGVTLQHNEHINKSMEIHFALAHIPISYHTWNSTRWWWWFP